MTGGSILAVPPVVAIAAAQNLAWFVAAWLLGGMAMSATLYPPAFAALTRWYGAPPGRRVDRSDPGGGPGVDGVRPADRPPPEVPFHEAGLGLELIRKAMAALGYDNVDLHQLDRWESKRTTDKFGR
ncbi:hypothetical protein GCM10017786_09210 [Amycolatopsis deserti]|uniref:Uncharacterized protein n=1 Tax=Amycolatopsis deserti TaxID=185696 RepID=A0ABQ3IEV5_9PSEU|nr:hypothetical protein GCM10017786_09210 [Amycolatopsis deserti]